MSAAAKKCQAGAPMWVTTFADLMSLLMCFFVLLLSFSELDIIKYKQVAGSLKAAFGVQRLIESKVSPKGTSIIAQEFSPGRPDPTAMEVLQQQTTDETKANLDFTDAEVKGEGPGDAGELSESPPVPEAEPEQEDLQSRRIKEALHVEISEGLLDVEVEAGRAVIRIQEKGSFPSGSAELNRPYAPVIRKIAQVLAGTRGEIAVAGHTDDVPIATSRFRSNWELSAARSVTVVHELLNDAALDAGRFQVEGYADSQPLADNATSQGRARNRRVEIVVRAPEDSAPTPPPAPDAAVVPELAGAPAAPLPGSTPAAAAPPGAPERTPEPTGTPEVQPEDVGPEEPGQLGPDLPESALLRLLAPGR